MHWIVPSALLPVLELMECHVQALISLLCTMLEVRAWPCPAVDIEPHDVEHNVQASFVLP